MKINLRYCFAAILCLLAPWATPAFAQGTAFTYQGRLNFGGNPANGNYDLNFTLFNVSSGAGQVGNTYFTPNTAVSNGLFTVALDFGASFPGADRWLELAVRTHGTGSSFTTLAPRQQITPTPMAIFAGTAANATAAGSVAANAVGASGIQDGVITAAKLAPGQVVKTLNGLADNLSLSAGANVTLTTNGNSLQISSAGGIGSSTNSVAKTGDTMTGALNLLGTNAVVGFGSQTRQMLNLYDFSSFHYGIGVQNSTLYQRAATGGAGFAWYAGGVHNDGQNNPGGGTTLLLLDASGNLTATGAGSFNSSIADGVYGSSGKNGVHGKSTSANDSGVWGDDSAGGNGVTGTSDIAGGIGVYGRGANEGVHGVAGNGYGVKGETTTGIGVWGASSGAGDAVYGSSSSGIGVHGRNTGGGLAGLFEGDVGITGDLTAGTSAFTAIVGTSSGSGHDGVYGSSSGANGNGVHGVATGATGNGVFGTSIAGAASGVAGINTGGGNGVAGYSDAANGIGVYGRGAHWAGYFAGPVSVCTLEIRGGCDVAEPFEMSTAAIAKGSVVVIDDQNTGQLKLSNRAYDTRVAGIISGANGINPGIALHQDGTLEGGQNVALSGRVYVLADASNGAIKPGDLLTTSTTPGHAMKVTNHTQAQGAILGKAMSSLNEGSGMVLVLVTLQ